MDKIGKIDLEAFESVVKGKIGKKSEKVLVGPQTGVDAAVLDIGDGKALVIAEDPIFPPPLPTFEDFGWYTVHIGASDVAVMGVKPAFMTYSLLMPPSTKDKDFKDIIDSIDRTAKELDISIVGGHTGYYPSVTVPTIGGVTVFSICSKNEYVTPQGAQEGDKVILTKGPAIEAVGLLGKIYEKEIEENLGKETALKAVKYMKEMTVVKDALSAMRAGGITSMHDATEGGVIGGFYEVASASDVGMYVDENAFIYPDEIKSVMDYLKIDAAEAISEGTLLITAKAANAEKVLSELKADGIDASIVGEVLPKSEGKKMKRLGGEIVDMYIPKQDPFWPAFFKGLS